MKFRLQLVVVSDAGRDAWTERGAHLLLQTRTRVLNGELEQTFRRWYPQFGRNSQWNIGRLPERPGF